MSDFRVLVTRRAERDLSSLDKAALKRIGKSLKQLQDDPLRRAKKLTSPDLGQYRLRVGDWRIIFDLNGREVIVLRIGHRREIYRRR